MPYKAFTVSREAIVEPSTHPMAAARVKSTRAAVVSHQSQAETAHNNDQDDTSSEPTVKTRICCGGADSTAYQQRPVAASLNVITPSIGLPQDQILEPEDPLMS